MATTPHDMIEDTAKARFPYFIDIRYLTTVSWDMRFIYWLCDWLDNFKGILKQEGVYEAIWASLYKHSLDQNLLVALIAQWSPHTKTILTCYSELCISLWDVYRITGLRTVGEMYDEFFH